MKTQLPILAVGWMICSAILVGGCHSTDVTATPYDQSYYEDTPYAGYVPYDDGFMPGYYQGEGDPEYYVHQFYSHREALSEGGHEGEQGGGGHGEHR
jgi:hypothetical protein